MSFQASASEVRGISCLSQTLSLQHPPQGRPHSVGAPPLKCHSILLKPSLFITRPRTQRSGDPRMPPSHPFPSVVIQAQRVEESRRPPLPLPSSHCPNSPIPCYPSPDEESTTQLPTSPEPSRYSRGGGNPPLLPEYYAPTYTGLFSPPHTILPITNTINDATKKRNESPNTPIHA